MPTGRCLCGRTRFSYDGPEKWRAHCHCESCRRATASPFTTYFGVADGRWRWTGDEPAVYRSSPGVERRFCATCGAPVAYRSDRWPGEIHFFAALLDDPAAFAPQAHVNWGEKLPWIACGDALPRK